MSTSIQHIKLSAGNSDEIPRGILTTFPIASELAAAMVCTSTVSVRLAVMPYDRLGVLDCEISAVMRPKEHHTACGTELLRSNLSS